MGRRSVSGLAHPGRSCEACAKCKRLKSDDPRNFHHLITWKETQRESIKELYGIGDDSCICDACRQDLKRTLAGYSNKSKKKERVPCFLSSFGKCNETSCVNTQAGEWSDFASKMGLQDFTPATLPMEVPICKTHYSRLHNTSKVRCAQCTKLIREKLRKCLNFEHLNQFNEDMGIAIRLTAESAVCPTCYNHSRQLSTQRDSVSMMDDLKDVIQEQDKLNESYYAGDMHVYAASKMVSYTGRYILEKGPLLLADACQVYHQSLKEAYERKGYQIPKNEMKSHQSLMIQLIKSLSHHLAYSTVPSKPKLGTLLMRRGTHVTHALHEHIARNVAVQDSVGTKPSTSTCPDQSSREEDNERILMKAAQIINSELRQQSKTFAAKAARQLFTEFDITKSTTEVNPTVWNFFYLLTETTTEQRIRDSQGEFSFSQIYNSQGKSAQDIKRLYNICHAMYILNDQASYPLHLMLADTVQCQGGSLMLVQVLNRLGIISSRSSLDIHKNAVVMAHAQKVTEELLSSPSFGVASMDNIDKGSPHAIVKAEHTARSVHGTSYQYVFPQPRNITNTGDDYTICSTSLSPPNVDSLHCAKVVRGNKNLYRCLARRNDPQLRSCKNNNSGILEEEDQVHERPLLQAFKNGIIHVLEENEEFFMDNLGCQLPKECLDIKARIELLKKESCIPDTIECAAVSVLAKCPVHIYRMNDNGRRYLYQEFGLCFSGVEPFQLLQDATGYDLLMSEELHSSSTDLIVFPENIFRTWKDMNSALLHEAVEATLIQIISPEKPVSEESVTQPKQKKMKIQDFYRARQFVHHSYEPSAIRAPPPDLKIEEFEIQPQELEAVEFAKCTILQYMVSKTITNSAMSSLKEVVAKSTNATPPEKSHAFYLGVINQHADDIETVKGTLELLQKQLLVQSRMKHLVVVGDAKTYGHLVKIKQEYVTDMDWLIPFPGDWHILKNLQPVLMKVYWHAGLHDLASKNHKGATLTSLASCNHFKRTHRFLWSAWEGMYRCQLKAFINNTNMKQSDPTLQEKLDNLGKEEDLEAVLRTLVEVWDYVGGSKMASSFSDFVKKQEEKNDTYKLWNAFIHRDALSYVLLYLAIRTGNWNLRVSALKMMGPLFHAFDRPMYLRLVPGHLADILQMPPTVLDHLRRGGFVVSLKGRLGHSVALDESHETLINRDVKMALHKPDPLLMDKLAMYLPYRAMSQEKLRDQVLPSGDSSRVSRKDKHLEETVQLYVETLGNSIISQETSQSATLSTLLTSIPADEVQHRDLATFYETGQKDMNSFISSRILNEPSTKAPRRRNALRTFLPKKKKKVLVNQKEKNKRIVTACLRRQIAHAKKTGQPIEVLGQYIKLPLAISKSDGTMYKGNKSLTTNVYKQRYTGVFLECLPKEWKPECVILEGMFLINTTPLGCHKSFGDYVHSIVSSFVMFHVKRGAKEVHVVFDHPHRNGISPKDLERERRDNHGHVDDEETIPTITSETPLPSNWRKFLSNRKQKRLLVNFLSVAIPLAVQKALGPSQVLITAGGMDGTMADKAYIADKECIRECSPFCSNHEESDSRVWLHAKQTNCRKILIYSPDTDTYHVGLPLMESQFDRKEVIVQLSLKVREHMYCHMNEFIKKIYADPDLEVIPVQLRALILQVTFIASGCDYTSFFAGCGKTAFYAAIFQFTKFVTGDDEVKGSLADIMMNEDQALLAFYRLVGAVYFKKNFSSFKPMKSPFEVYKSIPSAKYNDELSHHDRFLDVIREATWARADNEEGILPSSDALHRHWRRCVWVYKLWSQAAVSVVTHPPLQHHGYKREGENLTVSWDSAENEAAVQVQVDWILKGCQCKTGCTTQRCRCSKDKRTCGPGCGCLNCSNPFNAGEITRHTDVMDQLQEEELLQALNDDGDIEEELSDEEADAITWVEDACDEVSDDDN